MENEMLVPLERPNNGIRFADDFMRRVEEARRKVDKVKELYNPFTREDGLDDIRAAKELYKRILVEYSKDPSLVPSQPDPRKGIEWLKKYIQYCELMEKAIVSFDKAVSAASRVL